MSTEGFEIRDESTTDELVFALYVEGDPRGTARARVEVVEQMEAQLGTTRAEVVESLKDSLRKLHSNELGRVELGELRQDSTREGRFMATYIFRDFREVREGLVWYVVPTGTTGPDEAPAIVRNKLRYAVHAHLVRGNAAAEELLNIFK